MRRGTALLAGALLAATTACGDGSPTGVAPNGARVVVVSGEGQRGLAEERLPRSVVIRLVDAENRPLADRPVGFQVVTGGGSVAPAMGTTDAAGMARTWWTLGGHDARTQRVTISAAGASETVEAVALGPDETDVIILHGARGPMKGVILVEEVPGGSGPALSILQSRTSPDTLIPIQPIDGGAATVVAFPWENALEWIEPAWTPGIDTVRVHLRPPVPLAIRVTVAEGPFGGTRQIVDKHLAALGRILEDEGVGVRLGEVEILDRVDEMGRVDVEQGGGFCDWPRDPPDRLHVFYVHSVGGNESAGVACPPWLAFVAPGRHASTNLLAHEVGHLLGLSHVPHGLMQTGTPGATLTEGQIFQIHYQEFSAVNAVFGAQPSERLRRCGHPLRPACLPLDFELR